MSEFQLLSAAKIKGMLEQRNLWSGMHSSKFLAVEQNKAPAKISSGGTSYIISYYDEHSQYICTIHRILSKKGELIHEHVKDAIIDGVRYKAKAERK